MNETTSRPSHHEITQAMDALTARLGVAGQHVDRQREEVTKIQRQLEDATRELVRLEAIESELHREIDFAWDALADFESLELERSHQESERRLEEAAVEMERMARENWDEDGDVLVPIEDDEPETEPTQERAWDPTRWTV